MLTKNNVRLQRASFHVDFVQHQCLPPAFQPLIQASPVRGSFLYPFPWNILRMNSTRCLTGQYGPLDSPETLLKTRRKIAFLRVSTLLSRLYKRCRTSWKVPCGSPDRPNPERPDDCLVKLDAVFVASLSEIGEILVGGDRGGASIGESSV